MLDVGLSELAVVLGVTLVVLGPERLPKAARLMGAFVGKIRRTMQDLQYEFNREIELQELKNRMDALQKQTTHTLEKNLESTPEEPTEQNTPNHS